MSYFTSVIDRYLSAYGEPDEALRSVMVADCFAADATLADPPFLATGHNEIVGAFGAVQAQFPGHAFARTSAVDEHHGVARYDWSLVGPDGTSAVSGTDFVRFDGSERIASVVGFFGDLPARAGGEDV